MARAEKVNYLADEFWIHRERERNKHPAWCDQEWNICQECANRINAYYDKLASYIEETRTLY